MHRALHALAVLFVNRGFSQVGSSFWVCATDPDKYCVTVLPGTGQHRQPGPWGHQKAALDGICCGWGAGSSHALWADSYSAWQRAPLSKRFTHTTTGGMRCVVALASACSTCILRVMLRIRVHGCFCSAAGRAAAVCAHSSPSYLQWRWK